MGVSNPRDDRAVRNLGYAEIPPQHSQPEVWKRPSPTEPHILFLAQHHQKTEVHLCSLPG